MAWRALLRGDPLPWLLERRDPAVRASTLRSLLDRGPRDPEVRGAQSRALSLPPISTILKRQGADGGIDDPRAQPALTWLLARQDARGRWGGRAPYADRMPSRVDASKWVTLQVATILKHAFGEALN